MSFQVLPCCKRFVHDWSDCPFSHPGEKARRRDPKTHNYTGIACPDMKKVREKLNCKLTFHTSGLGCCRYRILIGNNLTHTSSGTSSRHVSKEARRPRVVRITASLQAVTGVTLHTAEA